jgi:hypothetical protein
MEDGTQESWKVLYKYSLIIARNSGRNMSSVETV